MKTKVDQHPTTGFLYKNTVEESHSTSEVAVKEYADCVVRALASFFEKPYDDIHFFCKEWMNRKDRKGVFGFDLKMNNDRIKELIKQLFAISYDEVTDELGRTYYIKTRKLDERTYNRLKKTRADEIKIRKKTIKTFLEEKHRGTYLVSISAHAFAIKDGVILGNIDDARRARARICHIYKRNQATENL